MSHFYLDIGLMNRMYPIGSGQPDVQDVLHLYLDNLMSGDVQDISHFYMDKQIF
jgi:hypothetical protein